MKFVNTVKLIAGLALCGAMVTGSVEAASQGRRPGTGRSNAERQSPDAVVWPSAGLRKTTQPVQVVPNNPEYNRSYRPEGQPRVNFQQDDNRSVSSSSTDMVLVPRSSLGLAPQPTPVAPVVPATTDLVTTDLVPYQANSNAGDWTAGDWTKVPRMVAGITSVVASDKVAPYAKIAYFAAKMHKDGLKLASVSKDQLQRSMGNVIDNLDLEFMAMTSKKNRGSLLSLGLTKDVFKQQVVAAQLQYKNVLDKQGLDAFKSLLTHELLVGITELEQEASNEVNILESTSKSKRTAQYPQKLNEARTWAGRLTRSKALVISAIQTLSVVDKVGNSLTNKGRIRVATKTLAAASIFGAIGLARKGMSAAAVWETIKSIGLSTAGATAINMGASVIANNTLSQDFSAFASKPGDMLGSASNGLTNVLDLLF